MPVKISARANFSLFLWQRRTSCTTGGGNSFQKDCGFFLFFTRQIFEIWFFQVWRQKIELASLAFSFNTLSLTVFYATIQSLLFFLSLVMRLNYGGFRPFL